MFDPKTYQHDCAQLALDAEKLEEMIAMTENSKQKKPMSRALRTALVAAACVAALVVTAMAAPAIQNIFTSYTITMKDGDANVVVPVIQTYAENGHNYLVVDEETIDITEALEKDGKFTMETQGGHTVKVTGDGWVGVSGGDIDYTFNPNAGAAPGGDSLLDGEVQTGAYTITADENGAVEVSPAN